MIAKIYRQSYSEGISAVIEIKRGEYQRIICEDCGGSGIFIAHDDKTQCNVCKGAGYEWINVY